jgi:class 3 adenylate cyclase/tetratricopeptide (TPR) repeat protein
MQCPRCQAENRAGRRFCGDCGLALAITCVACGFLNETAVAYCGGCGVSITAGAATLHRAPTPDSYTPRYLAERIITSKAALEGERKQVTVLFADLKSSMELLAERDPEDARKILDPVLEMMMEAVHRYEGTVNQVMGDGIMALFGAPVAHEDHGVRACYAALRMQDVVKCYADGVRKTEGVPIRIRVGLNSGEVVVRTVGSDLKTDYTAVGQTTHLAARMEQIADPGTTLVTAATLALAEGFVDVRALGPTPVKGLSEPIDVFELLGGRAVRSRLHAAAPRGLTSFVGRSAELEQLSDALELARGRHGQLAAVIGEPGVGKSRLLWEFAHTARSRGCLVLEAASASYGKATAYFPVIELMRSYFAIEPRDDARTILEKLTGKLLALDRTLEASLAPLLSLLDVAVGDERWERLDPVQRRQQTQDAVIGILLRESRLQPLVVVFEDLHWIDDGTQALLDALVDRIVSARLLLLVSYRPEYAHAWGAKPYYRQLPVEPLRAESAEELLRDLLGADASVHTLRPMLVERTDGNPLFLEEIVRSLVETRVLVGRRGAYRMRGGPEAIKVPATVQAIISARIDGLAVEDKRLLQAASVIGVDVPSPVLENIAEQSGDALRLSIMRLQAAGFLDELRLYPDIEYTFRHALACEVAYSTLVRERRQSLHAAILGAMERLFADQLVEHMERLAHHALRGEVWTKAVTYCRLAGVRARSLSANHAAVTHFQHALEAMEHLPPTTDNVAAAVDLRLELRSALSPLGEHKKMFETIDHAERLATQLGDAHRLGRVVAFRSNLFALRGDFERAVEEGRRALDIAERLDDRPLRILARGFLGITYWARGEYREAVDIAGRNVRELAGRSPIEPSGLTVIPAVYSRTAMVLSLAELGEFDDAARIGTEALGIAEASGHPQSVISACLGLGTGYVRRGDFERGITTLERGRTLAEATALSGIMLELALPLASAYAQCGRVADAEALVEDAVARAIALRNRLGHWIRAGGLAEAYLAAGRVEDALPMAQLYVEVTRMVKARGNEAWALLLLGDVLAHHPDAKHEEAASTLGAARGLARELGMRPLEGRCHLTLGCLERERGAREAGQMHLTTAADMFRALGMSTWLARAENVLRSVR